MYRMYENKTEKLRKSWHSDVRIWRAVLSRRKSDSSIASCPQTSIPTQISISLSRCGCLRWINDYENGAGRLPVDIFTLYQTN